jgi:DNA mismatch repair ATPase MutS
VEGVFHPRIHSERLGSGKPLTKNSILIKSGSPAVFLGANSSGKSTLAETILIASYFSLHFDVAPAARFSIPQGMKGSIGLPDYIRDPGRPKERGKFYTLQSQIASVIKRAKEGGYVITLDEPGEGTNGLEGRATIIALAEYLTECGNIVLLPTHLHRAVDTLETTIGVQSFASGLGPEGRYSFASGRASSLGLEIALEEGLLHEIVDRARVLKEQMTGSSV